MYSQYSSPYLWSSSLSVTARTPPLRWMALETLLVSSRIRVAGTTNDLPVVKNG